MGLYASIPFGGGEDVKLLGGCVGYLMGTEPGVSCNEGAKISLTDTTLLCIPEVGVLVIGVLVVVTLDNLAKVLGVVGGTLIRPVGKTANVACWIAFDSLPFSSDLSCPVVGRTNIGATLSPSCLLTMPGKTQPSYS